MARVENPEVFEGRYNGRPKTVFGIGTGQRIDLTPGEVYTVEIGSHENAYIDGGYVGDVGEFERIESAQSEQPKVRLVVELEMDETAEAALRAENEGMQLPELYEGIFIGWGNDGQGVFADLRIIG